MQVTLRENTHWSFKDCIVLIVALCPNNHILSNVKNNNKKFNITFSKTVTNKEHFAYTDSSRYVDCKDPSKVYVGTFIKDTSQIATNMWQSAMHKPLSLTTGKFHK